MNRRDFILSFAGALTMALMPGVSEARIIGVDLAEGEAYRGIYGAIAAAKYTYSDGRFYWSLIPNSEFWSE